MRPGLDRLDLAPGSRRIAAWRPSCWTCWRRTSSPASPRARSTASPTTTWPRC